MGKFACLIHPLDIDLFSTFEPGVKGKREVLIKKAFEWSRPIKISDVVGLRSLTGKEGEGVLILYNVLPEQIICMEKETILRRIIEAGKIAEDWGADIFGLAAYTAQIGRKGVVVANNLDIPVTTGTHYTLVVIVESILKAARELGMDLERVNITIIGATGTIGRMCVRLLSNYISNMILVGRNKKRLEMQVDSMKNKRRINTYITDDINVSIDNADIILAATNTPYTLVNLDKVQPGKLICDVSLPKNVKWESAQTRSDVLVIDGGIVKPPGNINFNFKYGLPPGLCYACMAETMILALEERYESYSLGGNVTPYKVNEIRGLANLHGFELAEFRSFNRKVDRKHINRVKKEFLKRDKYRKKIRL